MKEIWKGVTYNGIDYSKRIEVSNTGKLRNATNKKEYKLHISKTGYYQVVISLGSRTNKKVFRVHKAVVETFIPNFKKYKVVNHKDLNKLNNNVLNLEWCTQKYNMEHASKNNAFRNVKKGVNSPNSKLKEDDVRFIRDNYIPFDKEYGSRALARKFNLHHSTILEILHQKTHKLAV